MTYNKIYSNAYTIRGAEEVSSVTISLYLIGPQGYYYTNRYKMGEENYGEIGIYIKWYSNKKIKHIGRW